MQHGLDRTSIDIAQLTGNQALVVAQNEPTSGDGPNMLTSSVMSSHRSASIPAPSTSRGMTINLNIIMFFKRIVKMFLYKIREFTIYYKSHHHNLLLQQIKSLCLIQLPYPAM